MKAAVNVAPVSALVDASSEYWTTYTSGVITSTNCGVTPNFAVNIIGYGYGYPSQGQAN